MRLTSRPELGFSGCEHVLDPVPTAVGERDDEAAGSTEHVDGRVVRASGPSPPMRDDPEARYAAGNERAARFVTNLLNRAIAWGSGTYACSHRSPGVPAAERVAVRDGTRANPS